MLCTLALCLQLSLGFGHAIPADCGIWYMCGPQYPYTRTLNSLTYGAGVEGANWRAGYEDAGRYGVDAKAIASNDPALIPCAPRCFPISTWHGHGRVRGVYVQYVAHWGAWRAEMGPWLYRATWDENIPDYTNFGDCRGVGTSLETTSCSISAAKTSIGALLGIGHSLGPIDVVASVRNAADRGPDRSLLKNCITDFSVRWRF